MLRITMLFMLFALSFSALGFKAFAQSPPENKQALFCSCSAHFGKVSSMSKDHRTIVSNCARLIGGSYDKNASIHIPNFPCIREQCSCDIKYSVTVPVFVDTDSAVRTAMNIADETCQTVSSWDLIDRELTYTLYNCFYTASRPGGSTRDCVVQRDSSGEVNIACRH